MKKIGQLVNLGGESHVRNEMNDGKFEWGFFLSKIVLSVKAGWKKEFFWGEKGAVMGNFGEMR
jgi:hypothetical protein